MNPGSNRRGSNEEIVVAEIGQVGTQFDGFSHQTIGDSMYNCFKLDDIATRTGFTKLGVENVGALMTRGVLIDVAAAKGVEMLPDTYEITVADLQQALQRAEPDAAAGRRRADPYGMGQDCGAKTTRRYIEDQSRARRRRRGMAGAPGSRCSSAPTTAPVDVTPNPDPQVSNPIHQIMLVVNGIHLLENLKLDELAAKQVYEFALVVQPLKIQGGTGSTVAPIAVR